MAVLEANVYDPLLNWGRIDNKPKVTVMVLVDRVAMKTKNPKNRSKRTFKNPPKSGVFEFLTFLLNKVNHHVD